MLYSTGSKNGTVLFHFSHSMLKPYWDSPILPMLCCRGSKKGRFLFRFLYSMLKAYTGILLFFPCYAAGVQKKEDFCSYFSYSRVE